MYRIIGRENEQTTLNQILDSKHAEFVVIYGRRRVGKTFLIKNFFTNKKCTFFHITGIQNAPMAEQLYEFTRILESTFYHSQLHLQDPNSWTKAFELLTNIIKQKNAKETTVLFFDELPWLASQKSGFTEALDYYWNRFWVHMPNVKLIVCGSATSWMIDNILHHKGGLHNRVTKKIPLDVFSLYEVKHYLQYKNIKYTDQQILDIYMVLGGVPYYLNLLDKKLSVPQNIDHLFFNKKGELLDEFNTLYTSLFKNPESYEELIRVIASKREGIHRNTLLENVKLSVEGGTFNKKLKALETCGFIISFKPYGNKKKGTYYKILDEYTLFYLDWVEPHLSTIQKIKNPNAYWLERSKTPAWNSWSGYAFESVCFKHLDTIRHALNINASASIGAWRHTSKKPIQEDGAQIDLLFDRNDNVITICEIKYSQKPYKLNKIEYQALLKKCEIFKKIMSIQKQICMVIVSPLGVEKSIYSEELSGIVTIKDLLAS